ncbi:MAG: rod shape-determining protein MreC [Patescibacteria group bacterium]
MKLHSRHTSKKNEQTEKIVRVTVAALLMLVIGLALPDFFSFTSKIIMAPVHNVHSWIQTSDARLPMYLRDRNDLISRITELEQTVAIAAGTDLTERRLYKENQWLRQLLGVQNDSRIGAAVIARPGQLPYDYLQIDKGKEDGIQAGAPVYVGKDNVIGVVSYATEDYSFVELFTTPGFRATAFISGANVMATIDGYGGGIARVRVPQGVALAVGDLVHLPSLDPGVFGRIAFLENEPSQPEQFGYIALSQSVSSLHYVSIGKEVIHPSEPPAIEERVRAIITETMNIDVATLNLASTTIIASSSDRSTTP